MIKYIFIFFPLLFFSFIPSTVNHDIPVAVFKVSEVDNEIVLDLQVDWEDFLKSTGLTKDKVTKPYVTYYLNNKTSWYFDDKKSTIVLESVTMIRDHLMIKGKFDQASRGFTNLKIKNNFLIDIPNQTNNIFIQTDGIQKDYRMHKERTFIEVKN